MQPLILFWFFVFGTVIGSFLNVVIYRMHTGRSLSGRSHCLSCGTELPWYALIPVLSWLWQRGRCRMCTVRVSAQYPLVELATGLIFLLTAHVFWFDPVLLALSCALGAALVVTFIYDLRHHIIPDELVLVLAAIAGAWVFWDPLTQSLVVPRPDVLLGWVVPTAFLAALWYVSRGRWIGFGDVKLVAPLGLVLGIAGGISMIVFAFWIGAAVSIALLGFQKLALRGQLSLPIFGTPLTMKSEVPFAPFLILAFGAVHLLGADIFAVVDAVAAHLILF